MLVRSLLVSIIVATVLPAQAAEPSVPFKMAAIDAKGVVQEGDAAIGRYRVLLTSLCRKTGLGEMQVADQTAKARKILRENYGRQISLLDLLESANNSETVAKHQAKLAEFYSLYVSMAGRSPAAAQ